jgi:hypothetical protein
VNIRPIWSATDAAKGAGIRAAKYQREGPRPRAATATKSFHGSGGGTETKTSQAIGFDGNRWNDLHYSREFKMGAAEGAGMTLRTKPESLVEG